MPLAIITGSSRGLGLALARALAERHWALVIDARGGSELERAARELGQLTEVVALAGDVADDWHRGALVDAAGQHVDLLVNNASMLGPSPQPPLGSYPLDVLERVYRVNVLAPIGLTQLVLPRMPDGGVVLNVTSDAGVEAYEGWGGYGASKAALEHASRGPSRSNARTSPSSSSTPATCAPRCTRTRSPARTSRIDPTPRRASPGSWPCWTTPSSERPLRGPGRHRLRGAPWER